MMNTINWRIRDESISRLFQRRKRKNRKCGKEPRGSNVIDAKLMNGVDEDTLKRWVDGL